MGPTCSGKRPQERKTQARRGHVLAQSCGAHRMSCSSPLTDDQTLLQPKPHGLGSPLSGSDLIILPPSEKGCSLLFFTLSECPGPVSSGHEV